MEISEEELEKLVEKKVEERLKEREKESRNSSTSEKQKDEKINRRQFLKMAGLGAGAIGLTSATSALTFSPLGGGGGSTQTLSGVLSEGNDVDGQNIIDGGTTIWDSNNNEIPAASVDEANLDANTVQGNTPKDLGGANYIQNSEPSSPNEGEIWIDTSKTPPIVKIYDVSNNQWESQTNQSDLDNHTSTAAAHHTKPSSTESKGITGSYKRVASTLNEQETVVINDVINGLRVGSIDTQDFVDIRVYYSDGTEEVHQVSQNSSTSITEGKVDQIQNNYNSGSGVKCYDVDVREMALPTHSHTV